jgi:hypothetical protein
LERWTQRSQAEAWSGSRTTTTRRRWRSVREARRRTGTAISLIARAGGVGRVGSIERGASLCFTTAFIHHPTQSQSTRHTATLPSLELR